MSEKTEGTAMVPPMAIAELDTIRERLERALDAVEHMTRNLVAGRAAVQPDAYAIVGEDVVSGTTLAEAIETCDALAPVEVQGWAVVSRFWAVAVPIADSDGSLDGTEIMQFSTRADADAFVREAEGGDGY